MTTKRISLKEAMMRMAEVLIERSTCSRLQVACVLTSPEMDRIYGMGYNGGYKGGPNECESDLPGQCGHLHAEVNALAKADTTRDFVCFCTHAPCAMCSKLLVNAGCKWVYYRNIYRSTEGLAILNRAGIGVEQIGN